MPWVPWVALGALGCLAGCDLTASLRSGISKPQRRKVARAEVLIIHSDHPCQHLATITPLVAELDEMECFFMGSLIHPHPPSYLFAITWDVFIFRDLGFDKSTAILFFFWYSEVGGDRTGGVEIDNRIFFMLMCSLILCVLAFVFVMLRCGWGQQRRS